MDNVNINLGNSLAPIIALGLTSAYCQLLTIQPDKEKTMREVVDMYFLFHKAAVSFQEKPPSVA